MAGAENGAAEAGKDKDSIMATVNENDDRKLFVNSLSWETTEAQFKEYFEKFGAVKEATIKLNELGQSKGFGFILFEESSSIDQVNAQEHTLNGRKINAKKATPKERIKKIFVGGVSPELPEADIRTHFEQYGEIGKELIFSSIVHCFCFYLLSFSFVTLLDKVAWVFIDFNFFFPCLSIRFAPFSS